METHEYGEPVMPLLNVLEPGPHNHTGQSFWVAARDAPPLMVDRTFYYFRFLQEGSSSEVRPEPSAAGRVRE